MLEFEWIYGPKDPFEQYARFLFFRDCWCTLFGQLFCKKTTSLVGLPTIFFMACIIGLFSSFLLHATLCYQLGLEQFFVPMPLAYNAEAFCLCGYLLLQKDMCTRMSKTTHVSMPQLPPQRSSIVYGVHFGGPGGGVGPGVLVDGCDPKGRPVLFSVVLKDRRAWEGISHAKHPKIVAHLCPLKTANTLTVPPPPPCPPPRLGHPLTQTTQVLGWYEEESDVEDFVL